MVANRLDASLRTASLREPPGASFFCDSDKGAILQSGRS